MGGLRDEKTIMQTRPLVAMGVSFEQIQDELLKLEYDKKGGEVQSSGNTNALQSNGMGRGAPTPQMKTLC